ncbi:MAG: YgeY family selenium metabolism-linked hydrolase [Chloroflexota bacterium]|nr:YgeY family selenium metabolism-linked hydrolase [Chloroflexota bacterium]MBI5704607.1 YgeY family selenium metabolism-linked hydrolase [Chloroflexota bacterium]
MNKQSLIELTQRLVRQQSLSGEEGPVTQLIVEEMKSLGFDKVWVDENGSAVGVIEGTKPGKTILFDAHTDTVGIAPGSVWTKEPFGGEIIDGYLYGRGAADMKGALAAMLHAAASVDRDRIAGRVVVSASVLEEVYEGGALKTVMQAVHPDFVVIGEASNLNLVHGGRGRAEIHIETIGKPAHSSSPHLGVNAVHLMMKVVEAVEKIPLGEHPLLGPAILALTDIISEPYPGYSVIPSRCKVTYDRRLLPGETVEDALGGINSLPALKDIPFKAVIAQGEHRSYTGATLTCTKFFPAWELDTRHPFVQMALKGLREAGLSPQLSAYRFCTNAAYSMGQAGVPTVGFGPGTEADAHVVDERLSLEALEKAAEGYRGIIQAVLGGEFLV